MQGLLCKAEVRRAGCPITLLTYRVLLFVLILFWSSFFRLGGAWLGGCRGGGGGGGCVAVESGFGWLVMRRWSVIVMLRKGLLGGLACQRVQGLVFVCIRGLRVALCGALRLIVW